MRNMDDGFWWSVVVTIVGAVVVSCTLAYPVCERADTVEVNLRHAGCEAMCGNHGVLLFNGGHPSDSAQLECVCRP